MAQLTPPFYAGIDVGGTTIKIGLVDDQGQTIANDAIPTNQEDGVENAAKRSAEMVAQLAERGGISVGDLVAAGLASPGPMDTPAGVLLCPGNLPAWHNTPIRGLFSDATGLPTTYANDANAAAFGEFWAGAGGKHKSLVMFTLGTGVGGGIVLAGDDGQGEVVVGEHSVGAELGHVIINCGDDAPPNSLGIRGSLEGYCGSYGVKWQVDSMLEDGSVETSLRARLAAGETFSPKMVSEEAERGDAAAMRVVCDTARYLAVGIVSAVHTIDPEAVVIGGSLTFGGAGHPLGERFLDEVRNQTRSMLIPSIRDVIVIEFAELGGSAGYIGAAGLARRARRAAV